MDQHGLSIQVCRTPGDLQSAEAAEMVLLEGLGDNLYELFATLDDYPQGHCKYFLKKQLTGLDLS